MVAEEPKPQQSASGLSDLYLALIIAGATLVLISLVVCCYCLCCRKKKDSRISHNEPRNSDLTHGDWTKKESAQSMVGPPNKAFSQYSHFDEKSLKNDKNFIKQKEALKDQTELDRREFEEI